MGLSIRLTSTSAAQLLISDVNDATDGDAYGLRKAGSVYIPALGTVSLVYTDSVALSFQSGSIRGFIDQGILTPSFVFGDTFQQALAQGSYVLFFQPGGVEEGNTYTTWEGVYAALQTAPKGNRLIVVDDNLGVPTVTAGAWDLTDTLIAGPKDSGIPPTLVVADGATLTNFTQASWVGIDFQGSTPAVTISADANLILTEVTINCSGTSPGIVIEGAGTDLIMAIIGGLILAPSGGAAGTIECRDGGDIILQFSTGFGVPYIPANVFSSNGVGASTLDFYPQTPAHFVSYSHANYLGGINVIGQTPYSVISDFISENVQIGLKKGFQAVDTSGGGPYTSALVGPATVPDGYEVTVKDIGDNASANNITVSTAAGDIDGNPTAGISVNNGAITFRSNGVNQWNIVSRAG